MIKHIILVSFCIISLEGLGNNRIKAPVDPAKRCVSSKINHEKCEDMRKKSIDIGCITYEEYYTLKKYGAFPSCNILKGEGLDMLDGWCPCGCFHPDTLIKVITSNNFFPLDIRAKKILENHNKFSLAHLSKDSQIKNFFIDYSPIRLITYGEEKKKMISIRTEDGRTLEITKEHPVFVAPGKMKFAHSLNTNDLLLDISSQEVAIQRIEEKEYYGDVVNFSTDKDSVTEHIIFANNLAVGDQYWQASLEDHMNQVLVYMQ
ncbi:MAG: hypothetical protein CMP11_05190 [Zetaproteobacteria bacterium]|nr:hypothetical protein [Pseudobdellovibrionaceae bacterium]